MNSETLFSAEEISNRVRELGEEISAWAKTSSEPIYLLWLAEGTFIFVADLAREINADVRIVSLRASSYGNNFSSSNKVYVSEDFSQFSDKKILLVDDIFDTGLTLKTIIENLEKSGAKEIKTCVLLDKVSTPKKSTTPNYVGFNIPNKFVFGYGLDVAEKYRNLKEIKYLTSL